MYIECILIIHWIYIECTLNTHWNIAKHGAIIESIANTKNTEGHFEH